MGNVECRYFHSGDFEWNLLENRCMILLDAFGDIMATEQSIEYPGSAEQRHVSVITEQIVRIPNMVAMVVSEKKSTDVFHCNSVLFENILYLVSTYAGIYYHSSLVRTDIATVSRGTGTERNIMEFTDRVIDSVGIRRITGSCPIIETGILLPLLKRERRLIEVDFFHYSTSAGMPALIAVDKKDGRSLAIICFTIFPFRGREGNYGFVERV